MNNKSMDDRDDEMTLRVYAIAAMNALMSGERRLSGDEIVDASWDIASKMMSHEKKIMAQRDAERSARSDVPS